MKPILRALATGVFLYLTAAYAAPMVATFEGTITSFTSSAVISGVSVGNPFSVQVYYDLSPTVSSNNGTFINNLPVPPTYAAYHWFGEGYSMNASFGAYNISTTDNTTIDVRNSLEFSGPVYQNGFSIYNAFAFTSDGYAAEGAGFLSVGLVSVVSQPGTGVSFPDATLESVVDYPVANFNQGGFRAAGRFNGVSGDVTGQITSYHIAAVPEPSTVLLGLVGALGFCLCRSRDRSGTGSL